MTREQKHKAVELLDNYLLKYRQYKEIGAKRSASEWHDYYSGVYVAVSQMLGLENQRVVCEDGKHTIEEVEV